MSRHLLLDTDIILAAFRGDREAGAFWATLESSQLVCSTVTYVEVAAGELHRDPRRNRTLQQIFSGFTFIPLSEQIAKRAGREAARLGSAVARVGYADLAIAATALTERRALVTRNRKHFSLIAGVRIEAWAS